MKDLEIEVSSIANIVTNGDFELWENNVPLGWTAVQGDGSVGYANTLWGLGVQFIIPEEVVSDKPYIYQTIQSSSLVDNASYEVGMWAKKDVQVTLHDSDGVEVELLESTGLSTDWTFYSNNFQYDSAWGNPSIRIAKRLADNSAGNKSVAYLDNIYIYDNDWYPERQELKMTAIKDFENFTREIEDDLFTFKSDALSFTIRNYGADGSYFNTNDFETYSDRIFRFDILATYEGADESDIVKKMTLFSNSDTITKTRVPLSNDFNIQLYEISTLFKDNGWFLGKVITDEDLETTFFKYNTYRGTDPSTIASRVSTEVVLSNLQNDIRDLIKRRFIPVPINEFVITNEIVVGENSINIEYEWIINDASNRYIVLDMAVSLLGRVFLMLLPYERIDSSIGDHEVTIWEMINGSTLVQLITPDMTWVGDSSGELGNVTSIGFIHDTESGTYSNGSNIAFGIVQNIYVGNLFIYRYKLYTDNSGTSIQGGNYNDPNDDDIKLYYKPAWIQSTSSIYSKLNKCRFIDDEGYTAIPDLYDPNKDNMLWFDEVTTEFSNADGTYIVSNLNTEGSNDTFKIVYANNLNAQINRFPQYYTFVFKDAFPSDVLKDICVSQDAMWYLEYSQTNNDITLIMKSRSFGQPLQAINDNIALREDSFVRRIKFSDLDGTIFRDDATRLNYYLAYYNSTYGGGRFEKEFEMKGYRDYSIGKTVEYNYNNYFIKRYEYYTNVRKTLVTLFQKAD